MREFGRIPLADMPKKPEEDPFLVGVAISVYQNSGGPGSNWSRFETQKNWLGQSVIEVIFPKLPNSCLLLSRPSFSAHRRIQIEPHKFKQLQHR